MLYNSRQLAQRSFNTGKLMVQVQPRWWCYSCCTVLHIFFHSYSVITTRMITIIINMIAVNIKTHFPAIMVIFFFIIIRFVVFVFLYLSIVVWVLWCLREQCVGALVAESLRHAVCDCVSCNVIVLLLLYYVFMSPPFNTHPTPLKTRWSISRGFT